MHVYMITRGIKHQVDRFISELSAKYLKWRGMAEGDTEKKDYVVQVAVRPIQLYEVVFPREFRDHMLTTLLPNPADFGRNGFAEHQKKYKKFIWPLRKLLGAKPIPKDAQHLGPSGMIPLERSGVQCIVVGLKDDEVNEQTGERL